MTEKPGTYNPLMLVPKEPREEPDAWTEALERARERLSQANPFEGSPSSEIESAESSKSEATSQETAKEEHR